MSLMYACNSENFFKSYNLNKGETPYDFDRGEVIVLIGAYCLMPNHFHILITENIDGGISKFMQKLSTAYSMYYNKKYERTGSMFEGKFKAEHVGTDRYLKYLFSYIHLNPIKIINSEWKEKGIKNKSEALKYLAGFEFSSYFDYLNISRVQNTILERKSFPDYFPTQDSFNREVFDWINYKSS